MMQGLEGLQAQGRVHGDLKLKNIRVLLGKDGQVVHCTLHDLGGSVAYSGKPSHMLPCMHCNAKALLQGKRVEVRLPPVQDALQMAQSICQHPQTLSVLRSAASWPSARPNLATSKALPRMYGLWDACCACC